MSIAIQPITLKWFVDRLDARQPFSFSRWGDGEWKAIVGIGSKYNCDGQPYASVQDDLRRVLMDNPSYLMGMQPLAVRLFGPDIEKWLAGHRLSFRWVDGGVFHWASIKNDLGSFLEVLRTRKVILVGPDHLRTFPEFPVNHFVCVEGKGKAQASRGRVYSEAVVAARKIAEPVVLVSAGMTAKGLIHDLHRTPNIGRATFIDCGSLWDPYVGVASRSYHGAVIKRLSERKP